MGTGGGGGNMRGEVDMREERVSPLVARAGKPI